MSSHSHSPPTPRTGSMGHLSALRREVHVLYFHRQYSKPEEPGNPKRKQVLKTTSEKHRNDGS